MPTSIKRSGCFCLDTDQRPGMAEVVVPPTHTGGEARTAIDRKCTHVQLVQLSIAALSVPMRAYVDKVFGVFLSENRPADRHGKSGRATRRGETRIVALLCCRPFSGSTPEETRVRPSTESAITYNWSSFPSLPFSFQSVPTSVKRSGCFCLEPTSGPAWQKWSYCQNW